MFPIQPSGLSILDKFKQSQNFGRMLHRNETSKNPLTFSQGIFKLGLLIQLEDYFLGEMSIIIFRPSFLGAC